MAPRLLTRYDVQDLVIQVQNNFGDDRAEFLINNRLSFMRFLGLNVTPIFHLGPTGIAG
jgi:hypothetical protein